MDRQVQAAAQGDFERGAVSKAMRPERLAALRAVLEAAGVAFADGEAPGVTLREPGP